MIPFRDNIRTVQLQWENPLLGNFFPVVNEMVAFAPRVDVLILGIHLESSCLIGDPTRAFSMGVFVGKSDTNNIDFTARVDQETAFYLGHVYRGSSSTTDNQIQNKASSIQYQFPLCPILFSHEYIVGWSSGHDGGPVPADDNNRTTGIAHITFIPL